MKKIIAAAIILITSTALKAQIITPVHWSYAVKRTGKTEATVFIKANIDDGWHIYSQTLKEGGPVKTSFNFNTSKNYELIGSTIEPKPITQFDHAFSMNVSYFEKAVIFQQKIRLKVRRSIIKGHLTYMTCNDSKCLPPEDVGFSVTIE